MPYVQATPEEFLSTNAFHQGSKVKGMNYLEEKPRVDPIDRVKNMVRHSLVASPTVTNKELFERAQEIAPAVVDGMSLKQFHAKFRLPVTRFEMGTRPRSERKPRSSSATNGNGAAASDAPAANGDTKSAQKKRARTRTRKSSAAAVSVNGVSRGLIRTAIIDFVVELERAEQRSDLIQVVSRVDTIVDRILQITGDGPAPAAPAVAAPAVAAPA
jgi:hypothetical protein